MSPIDPIDDGVTGESIPAFATLRRALRQTPAFARGLAWSVGFATFASAGRLAIPVLVQLVIDRGFGDDEVDSGYVLVACAVAAVLVLAVGVSALVARLRMLTAAENGVRDLRVAAFERVHQLSLADHNEQRRGALVARVTSDIDIISRFLGWGGVAWPAESTLIVGVLVVMAVYSWQLTLVVVGLIVVILPLVRILQKRQVAAYDLMRTRVGELLGLTGEMLGGAETVRAYGYRGGLRDRLHTGVRREYLARVLAARYFSVIFAISDILAAATVVGVTVTFYLYGNEWGLGTGEFVAFLLLLGILQRPVAQLTEILDQTQTALAGWHKVLALLDTEPSVVEPDPGVALPEGPLAIDVDGVSFAYADGAMVLHDVSVAIPAGADVAVVGETGSGKTTFARLLVRLADPVAGSVRLGGVELADVSADARRSAVRMVPQDGFLFDATVADNIAYGRRGADAHDIEVVLDDLGLTGWIERLPDGLATEVGERGERLSVGERQLVALARAALADPGLLVLDEATSSVDPETEQILSVALQRLAADRTTVAIAHRLSTAERADIVLVFDDGRLVEQGHHRELVTADGVYAGLYRSWQRATSASAGEGGPMSAL